jgi:hypothetical protein
MAQLIEFGCEKCFRDHVEANKGAGIPSMEQAHATFAVLFEEIEDTFEAAENLMDTDAEVRCPRGHVVPVDEMRGGLEIDDQTVPRGMRVIKRKRSK